MSGDRITLKSLSVEEIDKLSDLQMYNIMFGPLVNGIQDLYAFGEEELNKTCVAVYGATSKKIKDRVETAARFSSKRKPKMIIFSGGHSWDGVGIRKDGSHTKFWSNGVYVNRLFNRSNEFCEDFSFLENVVADRMIAEYVNRVLEDMYADENLNVNLMAAYNAREESKKDYTFVKWFSERTKADWKAKQILNEYTINQYIINHFSEADIMNYFWKYLGGAQSGIHTCKENASNNTFENATYCMEILSKDAPETETMAVVSEWPYLLRAIATTKKQGDIHGIKVLPLPAEGFKYDRKMCMKLLRDEAKKIIQYDDAEDIDITDYIKMKTKIKNGPDYGFDVDDIGGEI